MIGTLLTLFVVGILGIVAISVIFAVLGMAMGLMGLLLFKVVPLLLVGWVILKLVRRTRRHREISPADQRWLDS